jgi:hypothetical protein
MRLHVFTHFRKKNDFFFLYSTKSLVFIIVTECVYCAVRTEYLYIIQVSRSVLKVALGQFIS